VKGVEKEKVPGDDERGEATKQEASLSRGILSQGKVISKELFVEGE